MATKTAAPRRATVLTPALLWSLLPVILWYFAPPTLFAFSSHHVVSPSEIPRRIWSLYVDYLWNYTADSWVAHIAYTVRVFAFLLILPLVILTLLDTTSYVIARTLGVVDAVKASTSDKPTPPTDSATEAVTTPSILISAASAPSIADEYGNESHFPVASDSTFSMSSAGDSNYSLSTLNSSNTFPLPAPDTPHSELGAYPGHNLKLSGVDVFSPATSQPPSPTMSRRSIGLSDTEEGKEHEHRYNLRKRKGSGKFTMTAGDSDSTE
ncbi:hypothetical protein PLICRDRAFT_103296 [Plicaturopsis crispa FD-325 SS-3]|nr:hypothetical protein PLICRDRAFT_103296 [Plicaturopsis crispa FD-325 SS-3]